MKTSMLFTLGALVLGLTTTSALAQGSAFTWQGHLTETGQPANGLYDLTFVLYDAESGGMALRTKTLEGATVTNGLYTTTLDFGSDAFNGDPRWLELSMKTNGVEDFTTLAPRQPITATPYAIRALSAGTATTAGSLSGMLPDSQLSINVARLNAYNVFTGLVNLPSNGLIVGGNQLALSGGNVGIGTASPSSKLHIIGQHGPVTSPTYHVNTSYIFENNYENFIEFMTPVSPPGNPSYPNGAGILFRRPSDSSGSFSGAIMYTHQTDDLRLWTRATQRLVVNGEGNVGIGTTAPDVRLAIAGPTGALANITSYTNNPSSGAFLSLRHARGTMDTPAVIQAGDRIGALAFAGYKSTNGFQNGATVEGIAAENFTDTAIGTDLTFNTAPNGSAGRAERMRITSGGNIGIGTTGPGRLLEVRSSVTDSTSSQLRVNGGASELYTTAGIDFYGSDQTATPGPVARIYARYTTAGWDNRKLVFQSGIMNEAGVQDTMTLWNGNVGIGTAEPQTKLHLYGADDNNSGQLRVESTQNDARISLYNSNGALATGRGDILLSKSTGYEGLRFLINNVDKMIIDENGNVGIGIANPTSRLEVTGGVKATSFTGSGAGLTGLSPASLSGVLAPEQIPDLAAGKITSGTLADSQLSANIARLNAANVFSGPVTATEFLGDGSRLAGVAPASGSPNYLAAGGGTMSGPLNLPVNGLTVGDNQLLLSAGKVGIGTASPHAKLHIIGNQGPVTSPTYHVNANYILENNYDNILEFMTPASPPGNPSYPCGAAILFRSPSDYEGSFSGALTYTHQTDDLRLWTRSAQRLVVDGEGNVGIGTSAPQATLHVNGNVRVDGTNTVKVLSITGGADVAEPFAISDGAIPPGAVVVIDDAQPGQLKLSTQAYDRRVAGIVSGAGGVQPGLTLSQQGVLADGQNVALSGRVYVQADATNGPIQPGDLLTTSAIPGHAMKVTDHAQAQGAILGKAMSRLESGRGLVLVLVTLQ